MDALKIAPIGNFVMFVAELVGGLWAGSPALVADAFHLLSDTVGTGSARFADLFVRRPPSLTYSFGRERVKTLVAFGSVAFLLGVTTGILMKAVPRLWNHEEVLTAAAIAVAGVGFGWNLAVLIGLLPRRREPHVASAILHVSGDGISSLVVLFGLALVHYTGLTWFEPAAALVVVGLIWLGCWEIGRRNVPELMDVTPEFDWRQFDRLVRRIPGVQGWDHPHPHRIEEQKRFLAHHVHHVEEADPVDIHRALERIYQELGVDDHIVELVPGPQCQEPCVLWTA